MTRFIAILIFCSAVLLTPCAGFATTIAWTNASGGSWSDSTNWTPQQVPTVTDTVDITMPGVYYVSLDSPRVEIASLILGDTASCDWWVRQSLSIAPACTLVVHENSEVHSCGILYDEGCLLLADSGRTFSNGGEVSVETYGSMQLGKNHFINHAFGQVSFFGTTSVYGDSLFPLMNYGYIGVTGVTLFSCFYQDSLGTFSMTNCELSILDFQTSGTMSLMIGARLILSEVPSHTLHCTGFMDLAGGSSITGVNGHVDMIGGGIRKNGTGTSQISSNIVCGQVQVLQGMLSVTPPDSAAFLWSIRVEEGAELRTSKTGFGDEGGGSLDGPGALTLGNSCHVALDFPFSGDLHITGNPVNFDPLTAVSVDRLTIESGANLISSVAINTGIVSMNGGTTNNTIVVTSGYEWTAGGFVGGTGPDIVIDPGISLNLFGSEPKSLSGQNLTINGDANLSGSGIFTIDDGFAITVEAGATMMIGDSIMLNGPNDTLFNHGQTTIQSPLDTSVIKMFLVNTPTMRTPGTIDILLGDVVCYGGHNDGTVNIGTGATLCMTNQWNNDGVISVADGGRCSVKDTLKNNPAGIINLYGNCILGDAGVVINRGHINRPASGMRNPTCSVIASKFHNFASGHLDVTADTLLLLNGGDNAGDIFIHEGAVLCVMGNFENLSEGVIRGAGELLPIRFNTVIYLDGADLVLSWTRLPAALEYDVYSADQPADELWRYTKIATVYESRYVFVGGPPAVKNFYRVVAKY